MHKTVVPVIPFCCALTKGTVEANAVIGRPFIEPSEPWIGQIARWHPSQLGSDPL